MKMPNKISNRFSHNLNTQQEEVFVFKSVFAIFMHTLFFMNFCHFTFVVYLTVSVQQYVLITGI